MLLIYHIPVQYHKPDDTVPEYERFGMNSAIFSAIHSILISTINNNPNYT